MRRFSQRNSLVTLNEINITPLLDLAFVLLIIFVITRPMLEQNMDLNLPKGTSNSQKPNPHDALLVEISPTGGLANVSVPTRSYGNGWIGPRPVAAAEIDGLLQGKAIVSGPLRLGANVR